MSSESKIKLEMYVNQHDPKLVWLKYKYYRNESTFEEAMKSLNSLNQFKEYCERHNFSDIKMNNKENFITAIRTASETEQHAISVYKMFLYLKAYLERINELERSIATINKDTEFTNNKIQLSKLNFTEKQISTIKKKVEDEKMNKPVVNSFWKKITEDSVLNSPVAQEFERDIKIQKKLEYDLNKTITTLDTIKQYSVSNFFTNMKNNLLDDYNGRHVHMGFEYQSLSMNRVLFNNSIALRECRNFIKYYNIKESSEVKQILGLK